MYLEDKSPYTELADFKTDRWLERNSHYLGARLISWLRGHKDTDIFAEDLARLLPGNSSSRKQAYPTSQTWGDPIPKTDPKTLSECRREAKSLIRRVAAASELGHPEEEKALKRQYQAIIQYIRYCTDGRGRIEPFEGPARREYQRLLKAYQRALEAARLDDPEVYLYIKDLIVTGSSFRWQSQPLSSGK
jgi:hypothetical protein